MSVKLELYRTFQEVAKTENISLAAQNLYISQSAVSQAIRQLEDQLQVRVCWRAARRRSRRRAACKPASWSSGRATR